MAVDIYSLHANLYTDKYLQKNAYGGLVVPVISLEGAEIYYIQPEYEYRSDLISFYKYGTVDFEDAIVIVNQFTDPLKDFVTGTKLFLPALSEILKVYEF